LEVGIFDNLKSLSTLDLGSNKISHLEKYAFSKLNVLAHLNLSNNWIKDISDWNMLQLTQLVILDLSDNNLTSFDKTVKKLSYQRDVYLGLNFIDGITVNYEFSSIEILDLSHNTKLKWINYDYDELSFEPKLRELLLRNTSSEFIQQFRFGLFRDLNHIDLRSNKINKETLSNLKSNFLKYLFLSCTNFEHPISILNSFKDLLFIDLSHNLPIFDDLFMRYSVKLKKIYLRNTNISELQNDMFRFSLFPSLELVDLSCNKIKFIKSEYFRNNIDLTSLNLSYNAIMSIEPYSFLPGVYTNYLLFDLSYNELKSLSENIFSRKNLFIADFLVNNNLLEGQIAIKQKNIFNYNKMTSIPNIYSLNRNAKVIGIRNNRIKSILNTTFNHKAESLEVLDLSYNQLELIENGSFYFLNKLKHLDLAVNNLSYLEDEIFLPLYGLKYLNLSLNYLQLIQRKLFQSMNKLETLDLGHNPLKIIEDNSFSNLVILKILNIYSNTNVLQINNQTLNGIVFLTDLYFSNVLIKNHANLNALKESLHPNRYEYLKSEQEYFFAIFLESIGSEFDDKGCSDILYMFRFKLNLNLKSDQKLFEFIYSCQIYFNKNILSIYKTDF
jgi:Leucine-rich repeat (LRR) protein